MVNCFENGLFGTFSKTTFGWPSVCTIVQLGMFPLDPDPSNITKSLGLAFLLPTVNLASTVSADGGGGGGGGVVVDTSFNVRVHTLVLFGNINPAHSFLNLASYPSIPTT